MTQLRLVLIILLVFGCSRKQDGSSLPSSTNNPSDDIIEVVDVEDVEEVEEPDIYEEPDTYEDDCYKQVYYYCPPLNETWRAIAIVDSCDGDRIVEMGPCVQVLECDPTSEVDIRDCWTERGAHGTQEVYCNKGYYEYGECIPCSTEICDGTDNDCDGAVDEGTYECSSECGEGKGVCIDGEIVECDAPQPEEEICDHIDNDCDGLIDEFVTNDCGDCGPIPEEVCDYYDNDCDGHVDEFQLNACGECGLLPEEICDGVDNDCNGKTDEGLLKECSTACETNISYCINGSWNCTAKAPQEEVCNGLDDDCDGLVDEELNCLCTLQDVGKLLPCKESPLDCGEGYKACQCIEGDCDAGFEMSPCLAACHWMPHLLPPNAICDPFKGMIVAEECNNHDDNCNDLIDEDLLIGCYTGPPETMGVGICLPGEMICKAGYWGNVNTEGEFVHKLCLGETTPEPEDICNGSDANCDGVIDEDKQLEPTDILFIIDMSGSMSVEIAAVLSSLNQFAAYYSDADVVKWGLVLVAVHDPAIYDDRMIIASDLTDFETFMSVFSTMNYPINGGYEMTNDAIYASIINLVGAGTAPYPLTSLMNNMPWGVADSIPTLHQWKISWRTDAKHVIIVFSDEQGQSYLTPLITENILINMIGAANDLSLYAFNNLWNKDLIDGFYNLTTAGVGGKWYELKTSTIEMYNNLLEILNETACSPEEN